MLFLKYFDVFLILVDNIGVFDIKYFFNLVGNFLFVWIVIGWEEIKMFVFDRIFGILLYWVNLKFVLFVNFFCLIIFFNIDLFFKFGFLKRYKWIL